jgi:hypothetical protein
VNSQNLSVVETELGSALRQRFIPSEHGSERVITTIRTDARKTYKLNQSIFFEEGFDWGASSESGKFGFGLGGGSAPTGGKTDKDGFTVRLAWHGQGNGSAYANLYVYSADRNQNLPYGDLIKIPNFTIPIGEWFEVTMRVSVNWILIQPTVVFRFGLTSNYYWSVTISTGKQREKNPALIA